MKKLFTYLMLMVGMLLPLTATAADLKADLTIYYDVSTFGDFSGKKLQVMIGHSSYSTTYEMKAVEGYDNLYSVNIGEVNSGNAWGGATQLGFMAADAIWGGESNGSSSQPKERIKWAPMNTGIYNINSTLSGSVLFTGKETLSITENYELPAKAPLITITSALPEFPTTTVGQTSTATVTYTLENADAATVTVTGDGFSAEDAAGTITVTFAPEAAGEFTGTLTITAGDVSQEVELSATAAEEASTTPEILNVTTPVFKETIVGETSTATVSYTLVNAESAVVSVAGEGFSIDTDEPGLVTIQFAPEAAGTYNGTLMISVEDVMKQVEFSATAVKAPVIVTISFVNPDWTEAALYAWVEGGENLTGGAWPGKAMTKDETTGVFSYALTIPEDGVYSFIINNNNNGLQSVDMEGVTESTCYNLGAKSGEKYTLVVSENCDYTPAPEPEPIDPYVAIRGTMTNWEMANDIKMTYNADAANGPEWYITAFEVPADGKFKVVSVDAQSQATWYGSDKVDLQEGITNAGEGDADIALPAGKYDIYFKVNEGRIWIQKYTEPAPEPDPEPLPIVITITDDVEFPLTYPEEVTNDIVGYTIDNAPVDAEVGVELTGDEAFSIAEVQDGFIFLAFAPMAEGEYNGTLTITVGEVSETLEFSAVASPVEPGPEPDPEPEPDPTPEYPKTITIKVATAWASCNLYAWTQEGSTPIAEWPGTAMTKGEDGFFTVDIEIPGSVNLIANNGSAQTGDYTVGVTESTCFNLENNTLVVNAECTYEEPTLSEPYYGIRGLDGVWRAENDIKLTPNAEGSEWYITGLEVDGAQEFKVIYVDATGVVTDWYGVAAVEANEALGAIGEDNIKLAAGKYDIYFKVNDEMMWIQPASPSTDAEEAIAELIYAIDGTIYAPAPFAIIDLAGKDVTNANGALEGAYIVKTQNSVTKVLVK